MRLRVLTVAAIAILGGLAAPASATAGAVPVHGDSPVQAVFVQTNQLTGNAIQVYDVASNGSLTAAGLYPTGGLGGTVPNPYGPEGPNPLGSQDSLTYVPGYKLLLAVNAGSNTLTVFRVNGDQLTRIQILDSGGSFPNSVITNGDLVYVLNAGNAGTIAAFKIATTGLVPVSGGVTSLNDGNTTSPPPYTNTPSDIIISPDGSHVLVNFPELNGFNVYPGYIYTFRLDLAGRTIGSPVITTVTATPFAFIFAPDGLLADVIGALTYSGVESFQVNSDSSLTLLGSATNGQAAGCWIRGVNGYYYITNTVSNTISSFTIGDKGQVKQVSEIAASLPNAGTIDMTSSRDYLYVQLGNAGEVVGYRVNSDGSLTQAALVTGLPQYNGQEGMEGIAAN